MSAREGNVGRFVLFLYGLLSFLHAVLHFLQTYVTVKLTIHVITFTQF